jgi:hypothetical protein
LPDSDEETPSHNSGFDNIKLSELGHDLAICYESAVGSLSVTKELGSKERSCSVSGLAEFGKHGGLCELTDRTSTDRELLRDVFFAGDAYLAFVEKTEQKKESHIFRRRSLLLILELCRQLSADNWITDRLGFAGAMYFGEVANDDDRLSIVLLTKMSDIATRWRMFYFHHYMAVALEGLFSWLVSHLGTCGLAGSTLESLTDRLDEAAVRKSLSEILEVDMEPSFGTQSPSNLFARLGLPEADLDADYSRLLDDSVRSQTPFAEDNLENIIRSKTHLYSSTGLAIPLILLATTLARYTRWEKTRFGQWLATAASDPYVDLVPPVLTMGLSRQFGSWWKRTWKELAGFVLFRYVVQQHQSMSFEKTWTGERCLLQRDGSKVFSNGDYDEIGMGNPRLGSAIQILKDLALLEDGEDGVTRLTPEGRQLLKREMTKEVEDEVS